ncbi:MAG: hypothetical protein EXR48_01915 [Dehalococcoidia bacterium]|nr:hypothetical protein [Dehalococcoidia bacterium]
MVQRPQSTVVPEGGLTLESSASHFLQSLPEADEAVRQEVTSLLRWFGPTSTLAALLPRDVEEYCGVVSAGGGEEASRRLKPVKQFFSFADQEAGNPVALAPHVKLRRTAKPPRGAGPRKPKERVQLTPDGHVRLQERLVWLREQLIAVSGDIQRAAADKDVRENAPLEAARQHQGQLMAQLREITATLENADVLSPLTQVASAKVRMGSRVTLRDLATGTEVAYQIVAPTEVNPLGGRISSVSPVGRAVLDRAVGDEVAVSSPKGTRRYRIAQIQ